MQTLKNTAESLFLGFADEPFKLIVQYYNKPYPSQLAVFDSISDDNNEWSAFKRLYGKCRVTVLEIDFREFPDGKNRIKLYLAMDDSMKIRATKTSDKR